MKIKKIIVTLIVIVGVVLLGIKGKGLLEKRRAQVANEALPEVEAVTVPALKPKQGSLQNKISFLAKIDSDKSIKLSTKLAGYVEKVYVEESQKVKKGDTLVRIDAVELKSNMAALEITKMAQQNDLELAKSIHARNQKLYRVGGLAKEKLELSEVGVKMKRSALKGTSSKLVQLQHQLTYLTIKAPFDGEIDAIMMHEGDLAATGKPILSMSNGTKKLLFSYAPTKDVQINKTQRVLFKEEVVGTIKSIYTTSNNGLVTAEIALQKTIDLPVGSSINIEVVTHEATGCIVPENTILHKKEGTFVMVYEHGKFIPQKVEIKMQEANRLLLSSCPNVPIAQASEVKLAQLPAYSKVNLLGDLK